MQVCFICFENIFPLVYDFSFHSFHNVFQQQKFLMFDEVQFINIFMTCALGIISKKSLST
jgi:hypothetical protein